MEQIDFIKNHQRFRLDFLDWTYLVLCFFSLLLVDYTFYYLYQHVGIPLGLFLFIETLLIIITILFPFRFMDSLSFQSIPTQLSLESNKSIIIAYLKGKGLEVIYSPDDEALLMSHVISFGFMIRQKEMTVVCMDELVLINIRPVVGKDLFGYRKEHQRYKAEIEAFIKHRLGSVWS